MGDIPRFRSTGAGPSKARDLTEVQAEEHRKRFDFSPRPFNEKEFEERARREGEVGLHARVLADGMSGVDERDSVK